MNCSAKSPNDKDFTLLFEVDLLPVAKNGVSTLLVGGLSHLLPDFEGVFEHGDLVFVIVLVNFESYQFLDKAEVCF